MKEIAYLLLLLFKDDVQKSLIDLKLDIFLNYKELNLLPNITSALQPIKLVVETLCSKNVNLYASDVTLKIMLDELSSLSIFLSIELKIQCSKFEPLSI